ncbi:MAG: endonuclease domain-containing protein [Blastococcus sp.]
MPQGAVLGGRSAAALMGAPAPAYGEPVTVLLPRGTHWGGPRGVRVHQAEYTPGDVVVDPQWLLVPHTGPLRTAWDVGALERTPTAVGVLDAVVHTGLLETTQLGELLREGAGRWGSRKVRRAFELVDGRSQSPPESWVRVACALAGLPSPVPQFDVIHGDRWLGCVDLAWPEARLIVEYEGAHHFEGVQIRKDDERYRRLIAAGWRVIRLSSSDIRDMGAVVRRIRDALAGAPSAS